MDMAEGNPKKRKADATPPDGYVCRLCSVPGKYWLWQICASNRVTIQLLPCEFKGHWIQVCPTKKTGSKKKKSDHIAVPGKDPSAEDIEKARALQKIPPPKCFCGLPSRLNKVKKSKEGGEKSRAIGKYFFFCSKARSDETQCRFARPVDLELNKQKAREGAIKAAKERLKDMKPKKEATKPKQICKFFAKKGECKKGKNCEFSHDLQSKKVALDDPVAKAKEPAASVNDSTSDSTEDESKEAHSTSEDDSDSSSESD